MKKFKFSRQQAFQLTAASLFLIGAVFMLINTFADAVWAFWVGLGFACVAAGFYILIVLENKKIFSRKMKNSSYSDTDENTISHGKEKIQSGEITPEK